MLITRDTLHEFDQLIGLKEEQRKMSNSCEATSYRHDTIAQTAKDSK